MLIWFPHLQGSCCIEPAVRDVLAVLVHLQEGCFDVRCMTLVRNATCTWSEPFPVIVCRPSQGGLSQKQDKHRQCGE